MAKSSESLPPSEQPFRMSEGGDRDESDEYLLNRRKFHRNLLIAGTTVLTTGIGAVILHERSRSSHQRSFRDPNATPTFEIPSAERKRFPYKRSPLELFAESERAVLGESEGTEMSLVIANNIANRVVQQAMEHTSISGPTEALKMLGSSEEGLRTYVELIADELLASGGRMKSTAVLRESFNDKLKNRDEFQLDCDTATFYALHAASRHDMPLQAVNAPIHMYLGSNAFPKFGAELTAIELKRRGNKEWEKYLFLTHEEQKARWNIKDPSVIEARKYFQGMSEEEIQSSIHNTLLNVRLEKAYLASNVAAIDALCAEAEALVQEYPTEHGMKQTLYIGHVVGREASLLQHAKTPIPSNREKARYHAQEAVRLYNAHKNQFEQYFKLDDERLKAIESGKRIIPFPLNQLNVMRFKPKYNFLGEK